VRKIPPLLAFLLALAGLLAANEGWRGRPYTKWTQSDVQEVLDHSPWVRQVNLLILPPIGGDAGCPVSEPRCGIRDPVNVTEGITAEQNGAPAQPSLEERIAKQQHDSFAAQGPAPSGGVVASTVRWSSSLTVREALVREKQLLGEVDIRQLQASGYFEPLDSYILYVDVRLPLGQDPKSVRAATLTRTAVSHALLAPKHGGTTAFPARIEPAPLPAYDKHRGVPLAAYYLFFLRRQEGKALLPAGETEAVFECPLGATKIKAVFDLRKMLREGTPDL
jgi:hypothetical protein